MVLAQEGGGSPKAAHHVHGSVPPSLVIEAGTGVLAVEAEGSETPPSLCVCVIGVDDFRRVPEEGFLGPCGIYLGLGIFCFLGLCLFWVAIGRADEVLVLGLCS